MRARILSRFALHPTIRENLSPKNVHPNATAFSLRYFFAMRAMKQARSKRQILSPRCAPQRCGPLPEALGTGSSTERPESAFAPCVSTMGRPHGGLFEKRAY